MAIPELSKTTPDSNSQVWQNHGKVVGEQGAQSTHKAYTLSAAPIKPIESMHRVLRLQHLLRGCL